MNRGWVVKYKDGSMIAEWQTTKLFSQLPNPGDIVAVAIVFGDRHWIIPEKQNYFSQKRESILFGTNGIIGGRRLESRTIGYWEDGRKIKYTLNELTGEMRGPYEDEG
jgi:hypothetical protein